MNVHHVTGFVVVHADVGAQAFIEPEMVENVFGGEEGCGDVVVAVGNINLEMRVLADGFAQGFGHIDVLVFVLGVAPGPNLEIKDFVADVFFKFKFAANVVIKASGVWSHNVAKGRVVLSGFA